MSRRKTVLTQAAGHSLASHSSAYAALSEDHFDQKRLDAQQAHHKKLLEQRLRQKRTGAAPDPRDDPDHPDNVRRRAQERQRQEKMAQKRLELKQKEARQKTRIRAQQRRATQPETVTVVRNGQIELEQGRELSQEERRARLKARQEQQRLQRREEAEANYNPFDPNSKSVQRDGDIWDVDDEADAMIASADLLHEITASARKGSSPTRYGSSAASDDLYTFDADPRPAAMLTSSSLGSFGNLLQGIDGVDGVAASQAGSSSSSSSSRARVDSHNSTRAPAPAPAPAPIIRRPAPAAAPAAAADAAADEGKGSDGGSRGNSASGRGVEDEELDDLLNDIL